MAAKPKVSKSLRAQAIERVLVHHHSLRDVASDVGVSAMTVMRWAREARERQGDAPPVPAPAPAPAPLATLEVEPGDTLGMTCAMRDDFLRQSQEAAAANDMRAAASLAASAARLAPVIASLKRGEAAHADALRIPRREIDEAMAGVRARVDALLERPLFCAQCGERVARSWGRDAAAKRVESE